MSLLLVLLLVLLSSAAGAAVFLEDMLEVYAVRVGVYRWAPKPDLSKHCLSVRSVEIPPHFFPLLPAVLALPLPLPLLLLHFPHPTTSRTSTLGFYVLSFPPSSARGMENFSCDKQTYGTTAALPLCRTGRAVMSNRVKTIHLLLEVLAQAESRCSSMLRATSRAPPARRIVLRVNMYPKKHYSPGFRLAAPASATPAFPPSLWPLSRPNDMGI